MLTSEQWNQLESLLRDGHSQKEAAAMMGLSYFVVKNNIFKYRKDLQKAQIRYELKDIDKLLQEGYTKKEIAKMLGVHYNTVLRAIEKHRPDLLRQAKTAQDDKIEIIKQLLGQGLNYEEIADQLGVTPGSIKSLIHRHKLSKGRSKVKPEHWPIIEEMARRGHTMADVARALGIKENTFSGVISRERPDLFPRGQRKTITDEMWQAIEELIALKLGIREGTLRDSLFTYRPDLHQKSQLGKAGKYSKFNLPFGEVYESIATGDWVISLSPTVLCVVNNKIKPLAIPKHPQDKNKTPEEVFFQFYQEIPIQPELGELATAFGVTPREFVAITDSYIKIPEDLLEKKQKQADSRIGPKRSRSKKRRDRR